MKKMKKYFALFVALAMVLGTMSLGAFAAPDTVPTPGTGTITINNAGIGETYNVYKVLDASVGANGAIVYPGPVPSGLGDCFQVSSDGVNLEKITGLTDTDLFEKLKTWAETATAAADPIKATTSTVVFEDLPFGYYVVVSTMDNGSVISVDSTNPDAITYEKNSTIPQPTKEANGDSYSIGDTITYTVTFPGANYMQADESGTNAKIVTKYEVKDTLPEFLSNATVTGIKIDGNEKTINNSNFPGVLTFNANKKFEIPWATGSETDGWTSLYKNGAVVEITYTAVLTDIVNVNEDNTNTITIVPYVEDNSEPWNESWSIDDKVTTYAAALIKTDENGKELAGAKFKFYGLEVEETSEGVYTVVTYDKDAYNTEETTQDESKLGTEMEVGSDGKLYIIGLAEDVELKGVETEAPKGYNKLTTEITLTPQILTEEIYKASGTRYYDAKDNLITAEESAETSKPVQKNLEELDENALPVENQAGTVLPSTGGIGTTIFYVLGTILVLAAGVLLVTRRRMRHSEE